MTNHRGRNAPLLSNLIYLLFKENIMTEQVINAITMLERTQNSFYLLTIGEYHQDVIINEYDFTVFNAKELSDFFIKLDSNQLSYCQCYIGTMEILQLFKLYFSQYKKEEIIHTLSYVDEGKLYDGMNLFGKDLDIPTLNNIGSKLITMAWRNQFKHS